MSKDTMHFDTCIRNGTVVTASERFRADIGIADGRVLAVGRDLPAADKDVDASGLPYRGTRISGRFPR
jgi:dihydropyrimidinase